MAIINSSKKVTRTVDGVVFTKSPYTGSWENVAMGISVHACYTGNMCSQVSYYVINVKGSRQCTMPRFTDAIATAARIAKTAK